MFYSMPIPREMKLRRKKGPALGGVASGKWKNMCCVRAPSGRLRALASSSLLVPSPLQPKHAPSARPHQGFSERGGRGCTRWAHGERTVSARLAHARTQWYYRRGCPRPHLMAKQNSLVLTALTTPPHALSCIAGPFSFVLFIPNRPSVKISSVASSSFWVSMHPVPAARALPPGLRRARTRARARRRACRLGASPREGARVIEAGGAF